MAESTKKLKEETLPKYLGHFDRFIKENGSTGFIVGDSLSFADLCVYDIVESIVKFQDDGAVSSFPEIKKLQAKVEADAKVKAYIDSRKPCAL
nr:hypothetical protein BaRGS_004246 [Batillaria attramentaria]KAG5704292.1 hypothetical protein BaRGS_012601 [Batillaria attramentaria]